MRKLFKEVTYSRPCELCGSNIFHERGRIVHESSCVRPTSDPATGLIFKYGFEVGQVVVTNSEVEVEGHWNANTRSWVNEKLPVGTLLELVAFAPKVSKAPDWRIAQESKRLDNKDYLYNSILADGSSKDRIRENFVTIRQPNAEELAQYRRGLFDRLEFNSFLLKAAPIIKRLKSENVFGHNKDVYSSIAIVVFGSGYSADQYDVAKRVVHVGGGI